MIDAWYRTASADDRLTQGDIILACPLIGWKPEPIKVESGNDTEVLKGAVDAIQADVIVITQACDLDQGKVDTVILCPHVSLTTYKELWEKERRDKQQNPTPNSWSKHCNDICNGFLWNLAMLNSGRAGDLATDHRVVDFHEVYTLPRTFLESLIGQRKKPRLQLMPPYREHLSQAFARFFMRVGLPVDVAKTWAS